LHTKRGRNDEALELKYEKELTKQQAKFEIGFGPWFP
jgi:hypothetical protein